MKKGKEMLYLSGADVRAVNLSMADTMAAVEQAFVEKGHGRVQMPPKPGLHTRGDAFIHAMPAYLPSLGAAGVKWVSGYPDNASYGLPYINGLLVLNCPETGVPLAVMDCAWITAQRTGAVSGVAAKYLAAPDSRVAAIIGCGVQARTQLPALALVRDLQEVRCYDIDPARTTAYIEEMREQLPGPRFFAAGSVAEAVRDADIVVTACPIVKDPDPPIEPAWLKEGVLALPIDFDSSWQTAAMRGCDKFYVDDQNQFEYYRTVGYFKGAPTRHVDLGQVVAGFAAGRENGRERIMAMNLGLAIEDMACAVKIYERALDRGLGLTVAL